MLCCQMGNTQFVLPKTRFDIHQHGFAQGERLFKVKISTNKPVNHPTAIGVLPGIANAQ